MANKTLHAVSGETDWHCEACGRSGRIHYVDGASVYEVLHILEDAHVEANGGTCKDLRKMRVRPVEHSDAAALPQQEPPTP